MDLNEGYSKLYNELVRKAKINKIEDFADIDIDDVSIQQLKSIDRTKLNDDDIKKLDDLIKTKEFKTQLQKNAQKAEKFFNDNIDDIPGLE